VKGGLSDIQVNTRTATPSLHMEVKLGLGGKEKKQLLHTWDFSEHC